MPCHKPFPYIKKFLLGRQTPVLYAVFCMLLCITPPSFSAEQFGPEASTVSSAEPLTAEGLTAGGGWATTYGGADNDCADSIQQTPDGGYIVAGRTDSFGAGEEDLWVLKLRPDGSLEWQKAYGGVSRDYAHSIQQTKDGGYVVAGETESFGAGTFDFWVLKLRANGTVEWQKTYGEEEESDDVAYSIQQSRDGGYIVAGYTKPLSKNLDILVLKLRPDGSIGPSCEYVKETDIAGIFSNARITNTTASPIDSSANPKDSSATVQDTKASVDILCPSTPVKP